MALTTNAPTAHTHEEGKHLHGGPKVYGAVLAALLVLTVITVLASTIDWGGGMTNVIIAMIIASIKGSLVALFFMHLRWDKPMTSIIFCSTLFFLGLFLIGCYTDQTARPRLEPTNLKAPPPASPQIGAKEGNLAPSVGHGTPGAMSPSGGGPVIPGASPQGSYGGASTGKTNPETSKH
jgi:cytochrome c oxidase subunit IV